MSDERARHRRAARYMKVAGIWLAVLTCLNLVLKDDVDHILVYALPVALVAWYGTTRGLLIAGVATLSAVVSGTIPSHPALDEPLYVEGFFVFAKLTTIVLGTRIGKLASIGR